MKAVFKGAAIAAAVSVLVACGGGGDDAAQDPQGFWATDDTGLLVTSSGEAWLITLSSPTYGLAKGTLTASGSSLSGSFTTFAGDFPDFSVSGTVKSKSSMTVTATAAGVSPQTGTLSYSSEYEGTPSVASLAGAYTISSGGSATISSTGVFVGTSTNGCTASGQITADTTGKNFYRFTSTYSGADCAAAGLTATGVLAWGDTDMLVGGAIAGSIGDAFTLTRSSAI